MRRPIGLSQNRGRASHITARKTQPSVKYLTDNGPARILELPRQA